MPKYSWKRLTISAILLVAIYFLLMLFAGTASSTEETNNPLSSVCTSKTQCPLPAIQTSTPQNQALPQTQTPATPAILGHYSLKDWLYAIPGFWLIGVLLAFTPCVLPLILMISGFFAGEYSTMSRRKIFIITLTYVLSIAATYSIAGMIAASLGIYIQAYLQTTWIIVAFSVVVALLSLSILSSINIRLPEKVRHFAARRNKLHANYTYVEVAIMGFFATLIASPCVAAPLVTILGIAGQSGNLLVAMSMLFIVGLGIGTPLIIATMLGKQFIPQTGEWQTALKNFFGLLLMGIAIYIISRVLSSSWSILLWSMLIIFTANYMVTIHTREGKVAILWKSITLMTLAYGLTLFVVSIITNNNQYNVLSKLLAAKQTTFISEEVTDLNSLNMLLNLAKINHRPVMLIFSAKWCEACHELDLKLNDRRMSTIISQFTIFTVDLTSPQSATYQIAKQFHVIGPPTIILFSPSGQQLADSITGNINQAAIKSSLQSALLAP